MKTEYIILCHGRGDYLTDYSQGEIRGGSAENAIRYTLEEATDFVAELGRGFSIEKLNAKETK